MKSRCLIGSAAYGPETLKAVDQAFDEAWASIADHFGPEPMSIDAGRLQLAEALVSVATEGNHDVEALSVSRLRQCRSANDDLRRFTR
jgi:hypothetical protein